MRMPWQHPRASRRPSRPATVRVLAFAAAVLVAAALSPPAPAVAQEDDVLIHKKKEAREKRERRIERNLRMRDVWQGRTPDGAERDSPKLPRPPQPEDRTRKDR